MENQVYQINRLKELFIFVSELPISERERLTKMINALENEEPVDRLHLEIDGPSDLYIEIMDTLNNLNITNPLWLLSAIKNEELMNILSKIRQGFGN